MSAWMNLGGRMNKYKFIFCENCKHVFEVDIDSHIVESAQRKRW